MPKLDLNGSKALVLGATRGIGRFLARRLAANGATLIIPYYDWPEESRALIDELQGDNPAHLFIKSDLRDPAQVDKLFAAVGKTHQDITFFINNIERGGMPIVHGAYNEEQWNIEIDTTLKAKWLVFQGALPLLRRANHAAVVTLSSIAAVNGRSGPGALIFNEAYAAANRAISSFTETWARQGAPNVRVNELMLGFVRERHAEGTRGWKTLSEGERRAILNHALLERSATLEEVWQAVRFLLCDATFTTGATLRMDGGYTLGHSRVPPMPQGQDGLEIRL